MERYFSWILLAVFAAYLFVDSRTLIDVTHHSVRDGRAHVIRDVPFPVKGSYVEELVTPSGMVCPLPSGSAPYEPRKEPVTWSLKKAEACYEEGSIHRVWYTAYLFGFIPLRPYESIGEVNDKG